MNKNILNTGVQHFIVENSNTDIMAVLLKKSSFPAVSAKELAQQIEARKKCEKKLPTWFSASNIYFPNKLNIEQTSSEITAHYKAQIITGKSLLDLTGGFGVDSYFFSKKIDSVLHCEIDSNLSEIASHNFEVLGIKNIQTLKADGIAFLQKSIQCFDWIFVDPSRRNEKKEKVFFLEECTPNIPAHLDLLFERTSNVLIKTAPLLDVTAGIKVLKYVKEIHIIAIKNEVKELLWVLEKEFQGETEIKTINFAKTEKQNFNFKISQEKMARSTFKLATSYLYEPNAAILKSGCFNLIGQKFELNKLAKHTHLYTSHKLVDFPGRKFKIMQQVPYSKKAMKKLAVKKANIISKNFPESVAFIRSKYKLKDGGDYFLFFLKNNLEKHQVLVCKKA